MSMLSIHTTRYPVQVLTSEERWCTVAAHLHLTATHTRLNGHSAPTACCVIGSPANRATTRVTCVRFVTCGQVGGHSKRSSRLTLHHISSPTVQMTAISIIAGQHCE